MANWHTNFQLQPYRSELHQYVDHIRTLIALQNQFEYPSLEEVIKVMPFSFDQSEEGKMRRVQHMADMMILTSQLIVKFSKKIPGFESICLEDQITLLKAHFFEVVMLRAARKYDKDSKYILLAVNHSYSLNSFCNASMEAFGNDLFYFCEQMSTILPTDVEYALLTAIVTFAETSGLREPEKVKTMKVFYTRIFFFYTLEYRPANHEIFYHLVASMISRLLTFGLKNDKYLSCEVDRNNPSPLLKTIWSYKDSKRC